MVIEIDSGSGFCFGVTTAIRKAEEELAQGKKLYCLGDIVHNGMECDRLREMGLITIKHDEMRELHDVKVLLRAHGEPPETYELAKKNNIEIIDATCPVVLQLQKRIKRQYDNNQSLSAQIVIFGKRGHAEVLGLVGQTHSSAIVIESFDEVKRLDFTRDIYLYSQTTKSLDEYHRIIDYIQMHISPEANFERFDTICRSVANRLPHATTLSCSSVARKAVMARCSLTSVCKSIPTVISSKILRRFSPSGLKALIRWASVEPPPPRSG